MENTNQSDDGWLRDEITGQRRKPNSALLNKKKLSKYELDELFAED